MAMLNNQKVNHPNLEFHAWIHHILLKFDKPTNGAGVRKPLANEGWYAVTGGMAGGVCAALLVAPPKVREKPCEWSLKWTELGTLG